ncbi:hypothetical protein COS91_06595 [Candidatus Desantisbacteria bacterium CG07_land_8_20_14_0_80_39_15]|uniref:Uncharacterized protein n=1 Tax=Candidatus Desantisbacteria bacterium CG07_land_8_20_14_0_80_39_15 TaxID=1974549 RepID=A0A2M6ZFB7_9BACT|nr:MAG: hypothetical protein COS91_06595 [Candidatus Desantisbacteria bacterium CG07_land_8_20_14_0_80_39_15]
MFNNIRVETCGIQDALMLSQRLAIWNELDRRKKENSEIDYLQVFQAGEVKVWVIDDGRATTMLLPDEY